MWDLLDEKYRARWIDGIGEIIKSKLVKKKKELGDICGEDSDFHGVFFGKPYCNLVKNTEIQCKYLCKDLNEHSLNPCLNPKYNQDDNKKQ